jgi:hypothetical protein
VANVAIFLGLLMYVHVIKIAQSKIAQSGRHVGGRLDTSFLSLPFRINISDKKTAT